MCVLVKKHSYPGLFLSFEGGEGSGKSSLCRDMEEELRQQGYAVTLTREPGGTSLSEHIRHCLLSTESGVSISQEAELLLFLAARAQNLDEVIVPALQRGEVVLCDRFNDSSIAYQGQARGLGMEHVRQLCTLICRDVEPDRTFFCDVDPREGLRRTRGIAKENAAADHLDRMEEEGLFFHEKVREAYHILAEQNSKRICVIDASQDYAVVKQTVQNLLNEILRQRKDASPYR